MIEAKVIEDSISEAGARLTTLQLKYPRMVHADFMTHRDKSRNGSSSRAMPVAKLVSASLREMVEPLRWGLNQPGMQASEQNLEGEKLARAQAIWRNMAEVCAAGAIELSELGLHKQWANRPTEWFGHISLVVTATEWANFFELRDHPDAQPEIEQLAKQIRVAMDHSEPTLRILDRTDAMNWHLPYVAMEERYFHREQPELLAKASGARCARTSYLTHDGANPVIEKDLGLYERLVGSRPLHASPTEHQGYPMRLATAQSKNFRGWRQWRERVEHEVFGAAA
jgi:thymidylate synthase ThyX